MKLCHACKKEIAGTTKIGRRDECSSCGADLHCCHNCAFHDRTASKQCREPVAEFVREKHKANHCDFFAYIETRADAADTSLARARGALEDLFKP